MLGRERAVLQLDNDEAAKLEVIEEQIDVELLIANLEPHLIADERKPDAELEQEVANVLDQRALDVPLFGIFRQLEEVEQVRILHRLILKDALGLPVQDRADIIAELLASLEGEADEDVEAAWAVELERRARAALADPDGGEPWDAVRDELRADLDGK